MRTSAYCYYHHRLHVLKHRNYKVRNPLQLPPLDSPQAIFESLPRIMNLVLAGKIDSRTAGRILYGIQLASTKLAEQVQLPRAKPAPAPDPSTSLGPFFQAGNFTSSEAECPKVVEGKRLISAPRPPGTNTD